METTTDPVCGMQVDEKEITSEHMGSSFYFCSDECKAEFDRNPMKYMKAHEGNHMHMHGGQGCC